ncbi:hypothetical protein GCM10007916_08680 [Psychromonas marina]|uniref:DUF1127 domain-containing protein n=1 Tax=Psychromonas marina TaxID=88364 RepID=A0ABQ6DXC3_9GAMM|nr:hypothetical protein [Psychromonas marina]GLS89801.1 hypothetical protein GCM10007916_08680 [Psychromonas marina]
MRQSLYIILATTLIKADIYNELRKKRNLQRAARIHLQHHSTHLMRDIGLQVDGFDVGEKFPPSVKAKKTVRHLRRFYYFKIKT